MFLFAVALTGVLVLPLRSIKHDGDSERESKFDRKWRVVQFFVNGRVFAQVAQLGAAQQMAMWG